MPEQQQQQQQQQQHQQQQLLIGQSKSHELALSHLEYHLSFPCSFLEYRTFSFNSE